MKSKAQHGRRDVGLLLIAILKLVNGVLLTALGIGALSLMHQDLTALVTRLASVLEVKNENLELQHWLQRAGLIRPHHLAWFSVITFTYAASLLAMGVGLLMKKRWAEYLTALVTASFIPLEIYELVRHVSATTVILTAINVATVIYLVWKLIQQRSKSRSA